MQTARLGTFCPGVDLYLLLSSGPHSHRRKALHSREQPCGTELASRHREQPMARTFALICRRERVLSMQEICATHRTHPARAGRGKGDGSVAHSAESFLGGAPSIWTC